MANQQIENLANILFNLNLETLEKLVIYRNLLRIKIGKLEILAASKTDIQDREIIKKRISLLKMIEIWFNLKIEHYGQ